VNEEDVMDDAMARDPLMARLERMEFPAMPRTLVSGALAAAGRASRGGSHHASGGRAGGTRRTRWGLRLVALAVAMVLAVLVGTAESPQIASAPLISPIAERMLNTVGLSAAHDPVVSLAASSTSAGHTINLVAGFADATRTVVVVTVSPSGPLPQGATLTDASGSVLTIDAGSVRVSGGAAILNFGPLSHPAPGNNQLTLRVSQLAVYDPTAAKGNDLIRTAGDWTMHFSLPYGTRGQTIPAPGQLGPVTVTFTAVTAYSRGIHVSYVTTGATYEQLQEPPGAPTCTPVGTPSRSGTGPAKVTCVEGRPAGATPFEVQLLDPNGRSMGNESEGSSGGGKGVEQTVPSDRMEWDTLYSRAGSGTYRLIMTWDGHRLERDIQVR
jgi:hypothetical protein